MFKRLLKAFVVAAMTMFAVSTYAEDHKLSTSDFIRLKDGEGLQVAVTELTSQSTTVTLYGVVHMADSDYYKAVQTDLNKFDAVLYEGVGGDKKLMANASKKPSLLSAIQHLGADVLDLQFQLDGIDYTKDNLVHADIKSMDQLNEKTEGESIVPFGQYLKGDSLDFILPLIEKAGPFIKQLLSQSPETRDSLKLQFAHKLVEADIGQLSPKMYEALVIDRNKIVIDVLQDQLKTSKKNFAIFYGAAHMPDMQERLESMGFKLKEKRWKTAWKITATPAPDEDEDTPQPSKPKQKRQDDRQKNIPDDDDK